MLSIEHLKNQIKDLVEVTTDADLLEIIHKLLLTECGDDAFDAGVLISG